MLTEIRDIHTEAKQAAKNAVGKFLADWNEKTGHDEHWETVLGSSTVKNIGKPFWVSPSVVSVGGDHDCSKICARDAKHIIVF